MWVVGGGGGDLSSDDEFDAAAAAAYPRLLAYARLLTGDPARAEDAVQEALLRCLRRSRRAEIREFVPYVRRAIVNEVFRSTARRRREPRPTPPRTVHPQDAVVEQDALRDWLAGLSRRQRVAIVSRYYLDMSEKETAELMGCSPSSLCNRGIALLRDAEHIRAAAGVRVRQKRAANTGWEER